MNLSSLQILDEMPVFYNLNAAEKREVLIFILQIVRNLDDASVVKAWQQSIARTRLFFKLMEECLVHFEVAITAKHSISFFSLCKIVCWLSYFNSLGSFLLVLRFYLFVFSLSPMLLTTIYDYPVSLNLNLHWCH